MRHIEAAPDMVLHSPMLAKAAQRINADGLVNELTVYLRPYPAVTVLRNRAKRIAEEGKFLGGAEYWELPRP
jgi:hypothetical protein